MTTAALTETRATVAGLRARVRELEAETRQYRDHAKRMTDEAAEAELARKRADRDADLQGQRADMALALADKFQRENKRLRAQIAVLTRAQRVAVRVPFTLTPPAPFVEAPAPCLALTPRKHNPVLLMDGLLTLGSMDAQNADDLATLARLHALEFPPAPF